MPWIEELPSGRFRGVYRLPDGKKRSAGTFDHHQHAYNAAAAKEAEMTLPNWRDPNTGLITWGAWCDKWWSTRGVEPSTLRRDESRRVAHLQPKWGDEVISSITRHDVKVWATELRAGGLSPASVQRCISLFSSSMAAAVDAEILQSNPASRLKLTVPDNSSERYLTRDEGGELLAQFEIGSVEKAIATFLLGTGVRWGEAAGARIENYDQRTGVYRVIQVWDDSANSVKDYPKGRRRRSVPVPDWVAEEIDPIIGDRVSGFIFEAKPGAPLDYHNFRNRVWAKAVTEAGVDPFNIHALRHTYASWLVQDGISLEQVGKLLGHVSPLTTRRYAHLADTPSAEVLEALSRPKRGTKKVTSIKKGSKRGANVGQESIPERSNVIPLTRSRVGRNS